MSRARTLIVAAAVAVAIVVAALLSSSSNSDTTIASNDPRVAALDASEARIEKRIADQQAQSSELDRLVPPTPEGIQGLTVCGPHIRVSSTTSCDVGATVANQRRHSDHSSAITVGLPDGSTSRLTCMPAAEATYCFNFRGSYVYLD